MGDEPILPIIQPIPIETILNWIMGRYLKLKNRYVWTVHQTSLSTSCIANLLNPIELWSTAMHYGDQQQCILNVS